MRPRLIVFLVIIIIVIFGVGFVFFFQRSNQQTFLESTIIGNMILTSPVFQNNESIPTKYTCDGEDINPPITIEKVPQGAKSLVLIMDDPDAPMGTWVHWTVWNIDPKTSQIPERSVPAGGVEGKTSFGKPGYGGPCPPSGTHRYFFKLYALDILLELESSVEVSSLEKAMEGHVLDRAQLIGLYRRE